MGDIDSEMDGIWSLAKIYIYVNHRKPLKCSIMIRCGQKLACEWRALHWRKFVNYPLDQISANLFRF